MVDHCLLTVGFKAIVNLQNWVCTDSQRVIPQRRVLISSIESISRSAGKYLHSEFQVLDISLRAPDTPGQEVNAKGYYVSPLSRAMENVFWFTFVLLLIGVQLTKQR